MSEFINLKAVGDLMLGDHPVCFGHGVRSVIEQRGFGFIKARLGNILANTDIVFGNLETVLSNNGLDPDSLASAELRGRPEEAKELAAMGFNFINVANNHALQHGIEAFDETVDLLANSQIEVVGLADGLRCQVKQFKKNDQEVLILSYSLRPEKYYKGDVIRYAQVTEDVILAHVKELRHKKQAPIVLSLHWGEEYLNYPSRSQVDFAHSLVDSGVNLILGHHPHVLQGVEKYKGGVIAYSLGNFIFDKWQRNPRESVIIDCHLNHNGVIDYKLIPILINRNYQPVIVSEKQGKKILQRLKKYTYALKNIESGKAGYVDWDQDYQEMAKRAYLKFRMQSYIYFILHIYKYQSRIVFGSLFRFVQRRLGLV